MDRTSTILDVLEWIWQKTWEQTETHNDTDCVRSTKTADSHFVSGHAHVVPRGHGQLITFALCCYKIPIDIVATKNIQTGDYVECKVSGGHVTEVTKINNYKHNTTIGIRAHAKAGCDGLDFEFGNRVLINSPHSFDFIEYISKLSIDAKKIALIIDESDDCIDFLESHGFETYLAKPNFTVQKKTLLAVLTMDKAKEKMANGENVVLFIESLNKLFHTFNSSIYEKNVIEKFELNAGPYMDLKTYYLESKQIKDGGSLTIIANAHKDVSTDIEKFVMDELFGMTNVVKII